jgi:hypothetical protein
LIPQKGSPLMTILSLVLSTNSDISAADLHSMRAEEAGVLRHTGEAIKVKQ